MIKRYTKNGNTPVAILPWRIRLSDGTTRTDPSTFTEEMIADAGYTIAPDKPEVVEGKIILWNGSEWYYEDAPVPEENPPAVP